MVISWFSGRRTQPFGDGGTRYQSVSEAPALLAWRHVQVRQRQVDGLRSVPSTGVHLGRPLASTPVLPVQTTVQSSPAPATLLASAVGMTRQVHFTPALCRAEDEQRVVRGAEVRAGLWRGEVDDRGRTCWVPWHSAWVLASRR
jgi:hypothetical protein